MRQRTLVLLKPDTVQRSLIGEVISRIERVGLKIVGLKLILADDKQLVKHYNKDEAWFLKKGANIVNNLTANGKPIEKEPIEYGKEIIQQLVDFMTAGPMVGLVVVGNESVNVVKKLVGSTEPATSDVGTIRGDYTIDSYELSTIDSRGVRNLVHCSDSPEEAEREIPLWFDKKEIINYRLINEQMLYDVNLDGIME